MIAAKLSLLLASAASVHGAEMRGYLMDNQCINVKCAGKEKSTDPCTPDLTNSFWNPEDHTGWCLKLGVCVQSRYALMSEFADEDGFHKPVLNMTGDAIQASVLDYIDATNPQQLDFATQAAFPLVKVVYEDSDLVTADGATPSISAGSVMDPWAFPLKPSATRPLMQLWTITCASVLMSPSPRIRTRR